jgi:hypothetical protein
MTTIATAAMINNKVTTNDWFLGFTVPPNDNSSKDYTNMSSAGTVHSKILYISLIMSPAEFPPWESSTATPFTDLDAESNPTLTQEPTPQGSDPSQRLPHG